MLAQEIDFHEVFRLNPTAMALLTPDLAFIDANDEFLEETRRTLAELVGHNFFEEFPRMHPGTGERNVLEEAIASGRRAVHLLARYDIDEPGHPGVRRERYWSASVQPIRGSDGQVQAIELSARNVTEVVSECKAMLAEEKRLDDR
jgi:PAS domain-containing protein